MWTPLLLPLLLIHQQRLVAAAPPPLSFVNTAVSRTVELIGATNHLITQYNVKSLIDSPGEYHLALAGAGDEEPAWWEVSVAGKSVQAKLVPRAGTEDAPTVLVSLGPMGKDAATTLSVTTVLAHASEPRPREIEQTEKQFLVWQTNSTYVDSWYPTDVERIKIRAPTPNIVSYSPVPEKYTRDSTATKATSTLTLGPFHSLPATLGRKAVEQSPFQVHYESTNPVVGLRSLKRSAEVSHWGGNLNMQDVMELVNNGPKLKGHFSRLAHQQSRFHSSVPPQILSDLTLRLPPTAHSPYYYDTIGNVSTSHFRPGSTPAITTSSKKTRSARTVEAVLELKPRYPVLGGWNYSFTVGYDLPLGDVLKKEAQGKERLVLAVPFLTGWKDLVVDDVELQIILPEGAKDVEVVTPFPVDSISHTVHKTYLDSTGRHAITITKASCTEHHAQNIYVTYTYPFSAQFQKPLTVAAVVGGLFILAAGLRRVDYSIDSK